MAQETVTRAVFEAEERGVAQTAAKLGALKGAAGAAASATDQFARVSEISASRLGSIERGVDQLQKRLAGAPAAWTRYERSMKQASDGLAAGRLDLDEYAKAVQAIQAELQKVVAPRLDMDVSNSGLSKLLGTTEKVTAAQRQLAKEMLRIQQDKQAADAEAARGREALARETARYAAEVDSLRSIYDPTWAAQKKMGEELENIARLEREGIEIAGGYEKALENIRLKYDDGAQAARRAADANEDFIRRARDAQNEANAKLMANANQDAFNDLLGVGGRGGSARDSASVFEAEARRMEEMEAAAQKLRNELDPLGAAYQQMQDEIAEYQRLADAQIITTDELAAASLRSRAGFDRFAAGLDNSARSSQGLVSRLSNLAARITPLTAMMGVGSLVGSGGGFLALANSSQRIEDAERAARRLQGVLEATGAAAGLSGAEIGDLAREIEAATGRAADEVLTVAAQLSTFTSIGSSEFERTLRLAADLAEVFGGSLQSNIDAVARALDDPIKGFQNLRQRGFALEEQELKLVEAFIAANDAASAQNVVLQNLEKQVGDASVRAYGGLTKAKGDARLATEAAIDAYNRQSGALDAQINATAAYARSMRFLADNMEVIAPVATMLTVLVGSRLTTSFVTSKFAADAFGATLGALTTRAGAASAAMALLGGPVGIGVTTVAAIATGLLMWSRNGDAANRSLEEHANIVTEIRDRYREADEARRQLTRGELEEDHSGLSRQLQDRQRRFDEARAALEDAMQGQSHRLAELGDRAAGIRELFAIYDDAGRDAELLRVELLALSRIDQEVGDILNRMTMGLGVNFVALAKSASDAEQKLRDTEIQMGVTTDRMEAAGDATRRAGQAMALYTSNLAGIREFVPEFEQSRKVQEDLDEVTRLHAQAVQQLKAAYADNGDLHAFIESVLGIDRASEAARDSITGLTDARRQLAGYEDNARIGAMTPREQALAREKAAYDALVETLSKAGAVRDDYERAQAAYEQNLALINKRFDEQDEAARRAAAGQRTVAEAGREATEALQRQIDALTQTEGASAAADFAARELARAWQEARAAGLEMIPPETLAAIERAAEQVGLLTDRLGALRTVQSAVDQFFPFEKARREAEEYQRILNDVTLTLSDMERQALTMAMEQKFVDAQRAVDALNKRGADAGDSLYKSFDPVRELFEGLYDILTSSGDALEKLMGLGANIGRQFAQMGLDRLMDNLGLGRAKQSAPVAWPDMAGSGRGWSPIQAQQMGQSIGTAIAPSITSSLNSNLTSFAAAIRKIESGSYEGNYSARGPMVRSGMYAGDHAYGAYQVMGKNIASWTKEALGHSLTIQQFVADSAAQDRVFYHKFGQSVDKFGTFADGASVWFSGRPLSQAGNRSDGYNTVPQYVQKAQAALDNYPGGLKAGVSDGMMDYTRRVQAQTPTAPAQVPGVAGQTDMNAMLGIGGAAFGAFAGGFQSGSPLGGALSGAMAGYGAVPMIQQAFPAMSGAAAGLLGIAGGAVLGLIGGLLGRARQKRQELQQARQELEQQMGAITDLIARSTGNYMGTYQTMLMQSADEFSKAMAMANKAKNVELARELTDAQDEFYRNVADRWSRNFDGLIASMESGYGLDSAFMGGMDAVEKMRESLVGFINDAQFFADANGDLAGALADHAGRFTSYAGAGAGPSQAAAMFQGRVEASQDYRDAVERWAAEIDRLNVKVFTEGQFSRDYDDPVRQVYESVDGLRERLRDLGVSFDDAGDIVRRSAQAQAELADSVELARNAAYQTALAAISGAEELTAMEEAVEKLNGVVANMPSLLDDIGIAADEAARAIGDHFLIAMEKMRQSVTFDAQRSINELRNFSWVNDLIDAQQRYAVRVREFAAVGLDASLATQELNLQLRRIAKDSDLSDDTLRMLADAFPTLTDGLSMLIGGAKDFAADFEEAERDLRATYDKQRNELQQNISVLERYTDQIRRHRDDIRLSASSPLTQRAQMEEALRRFRETASVAMGDGEEAQAAMDRLTSVSQSALDEARAYYMSSADYAAIWEEIDQTLAEAEATGKRALTEAQRQLGLLDDQVGRLIDINDSVLTVAEAIERWGLANDNKSAEQARRDAELAQLIRQNQTATADGRITALYQEVLGRAPDAQGAAYYQAMLNSGVEWNEVRRRFIANAQPEIERGFPILAGHQKGGVVRGYQAGGIVGNGTYDVDSVLARFAGGGVVALAGGEHVTTARAVNTETSPILDHINRTGRSPLGDLGGEIGRLNRKMDDLIAATIGSGHMNADASERVARNTADMKSDLRKVMAKVA